MVVLFVYGAVVVEAVEVATGAELLPISAPETLLLIVLVVETNGPIVMVELVPTTLGETLDEIDKDDVLLAPPVVIDACIELGDEQPEVLFELVCDDALIPLPVLLLPWTGV